MLFGHIRRNALHLKLAGGAVCQIKRKGVYERRENLCVGCLCFSENLRVY